MRLLDRYLFRELLLPLCFCLGGFLLLWSSGELMQKLPDLQKAKMHFFDVVEYCLLLTPEKLPDILPMALLIGLLYALTQHARHNEITAMRAAGISLWRLAVPYLGVGLGCSLALFAVNELIVPKAAARAEDILTRNIRAPGETRESELVRNLGFTNARERRTWEQIGTFNLLSGEMAEVQVKWIQADGTHCRLHAKRGVYTNGAWAFFNVQELRQPPGANSMLVPSMATNFLVKPEFTETPDEIRSEVQIAESLSRSLRRAKRADIPIRVLQDYLRLHPHLSPSDHAWLFTKLHGRFAAPWTCLVVVVIALPFGAVSGRRNVFVGVASSIFICFAFFVLSMVSLALGSGGALPPWLAAWLPNLVFGGAAVFMISRVR